MPTDGQLISLMSHTIGSIGQLLKNKELDNFLSDKDAVKEIRRIYQGYIAVIGPAFNPK